MPELPEVETIRRQLAPRVAERRIVEAEVHDPLWCAPRAAGDVESELRGRVIVGLSRRGKYLIAELEGERFLVLHLRMTGNLLWLDRDRPADLRYARVRLVLDDGGRVVLTDPRRFGTGIVLEGRSQLDAHIASRLGPEPLEPTFTPELLGTHAAGRRAPVKAFLLDQRRVAGIGNIYADEALFRARIHPLKPAGALRRAELERLRDAIVEALEAGLESFGASIDRYRDANGERGGMQERFLVHRREGLPCPRCGTPVRKLRAAGRGTYVCPRCQRGPRKRARATT